MPLPANVTTVTVLGTFLTPEGDPSTGTVSFTPSSWLTNSGANVAIPNSSVVKTLGTAGNFSAVLPITDDADLSPTGWVYGVSEVVDGVSQSYNILIPGTVAVGGTVFLADLVPAAPAGPEYYSLASSLAIGTVTTVAPGGTATATITGLAPSQVLNLGLVRGDTGALTTSGSGSVGTAAVSPTGDPDTGIYYPAANQVAITTGGTAAAIFAAGAISNPTITGVLSVPDGSASAPSITNTGDTNTGLFHPAEDTVAISTGGSERLRVTSTGVGIGITAPATALHILGDATIDTTANNAAAFLLNFRKTRAGSIVANGDAIGSILFQGLDGSTQRTAAFIRGNVDGEPGASDMPGRLTFFTTPDGSITPTERMRIDNAGLITGTGTSLGAWTAWTPTLSGTGWAIGDGTLLATYCQIGKVVHFRIQITFGSTSTFGAGALTLSLPVTAAGMNGHPMAHVAYVDTSAGLTYLGTARQSTTTTISPRFGQNPDGGIFSGTAFTWANTDIIRVVGTYEAA